MFTHVLELNSIVLRVSMLNELFFCLEITATLRASHLECRYEMQIFISIQCSLFRMILAIFFLIYFVLRRFSVFLKLLFAYKTHSACLTLKFTSTKLRCVIAAETTCAFGQIVKFLFAFLLRLPVSLNLVLAFLHYSVNVILIVIFFISFIRLFICPFPLVFRNLTRLLTFSFMIVNSLDIAR